MSQEGRDDGLHALIGRARAGDEDAANELFTRLYERLRAMAGRSFRSQGGRHTLQPTALVHEAFLKMSGSARESRWSDQAHFLAVAATAMRQVLVNHARDRAALKRGGADRGRRVTLADVVVDGASRELDVLAVHEALETLAGLDARQGRIAELRFFAGLEQREIAEILGVSLRTVELDWKMAKTWLAQHLGAGD